jgi:hypothetical protein
MEAEKRKALSMYLRDIRDPRRRQGRTYPLASILTMLTLAAVNGAARDTPSSTGNESATDSVGRKSSAVWDAMERVRQVEEAVRQWLKDSLGEAMSVDAKSRRGSRRELPALSVVVAAGQKVQLVLAQEEVKGEHVIEAALSKRGAGSHLRCGVESARDCGCNRKKGGPP